MAERALSPVPTSASPDPGSSSSSVLVPADADRPPASLVHPLDTYIVQVQKDQIYRVPPPENAYLVERYRTERAGGGKRAGSRCCCSPCFLRAAAAVAALAALLGAAAAACYVALRPTAPGFIVNRLSVHNASRQGHMDYDFFLTAVNPNRVSALWYQAGADARLLYRGAAFARGDAAKVSDGGQDAVDFDLVLHGLQHDARTPRAVERGLRGSRAALTLELAVEFAVQVHVGALGLEHKRLNVACEVTAAGLRKDVHISSQKCSTHFGN